jgi:hypothetical protein
MNTPAVSANSLAIPRGKNTAVVPQTGFSVPEQLVHTVYPLSVQNVIIRVKTSVGKSNRVLEYGESITVLSFVRLYFAKSSSISLL